MRSKNTVKQMLDFHKTTLGNSFSIMAMLQCQAENIFNFFRYSPGMSGEIRAFMDGRVSSYKKDIDDLKKAMNDRYAMIEDFYNRNSFPIFQEQTAKILKVYLDQAKCMPPDVKKTMEDMAATYKAGCDAFRKYVDKNFWRMEDYLHTNDSLRIKKEHMKSPSTRSTIKYNP